LASGSGWLRAYANSSMTSSRGSQKKRIQVAHPPGFTDLPSLMTITVRPASRR
jgi:hypothetical protein